MQNKRYIHKNYPIFCFLVIALSCGNIQSMYGWSFSEVFKKNWKVVAGMCGIAVSAYFLGKKTGQANRYSVLWKEAKQKMRQGNQDDYVNGFVAGGVIGHRKGYQAAHQDIRILQGMEKDPKAFEEGFQEGRLRGFKDALKAFCSATNIEPAQLRG